LVSSRFCRSGCTICASYHSLLPSRKRLTLCVFSSMCLLLPFKSRLFSLSAICQVTGWYFAPDGLPVCSTSVLRASWLPHYCLAHGDTFRHFSYTSSRLHAKSLPFKSGLATATRCRFACHCGHVTDFPPNPVLLTFEIYGGIGHSLFSQGYSISSANMVLAVCSGACLQSL
jgi:hypothetical protein